MFATAYPALRSAFPAHFPVLQRPGSNQAEGSRKTFEMTDKTFETLAEKLDRLIETVGRLAPAKPAATDLAAADCFVWSAEQGILEPVQRVNRVDIGLIRGVDRVRDILIDNTERFAAGLPANNVLLWGARGMGKSSLVKAVHASINATRKNGEAPLKLIEIHREDIDTLPKLMGLLKSAPYRFILFCDDLSFDHDDTSYKSLKAALEGGVEGRPANVIFYATSNRRHLLPRDMIDNERSTAINPVGSGRGKGIAVGSLRPVAWLPQMLAGRISRHGRGLCELSRAEDGPGAAARRGAGMGDHARQPLRPRRLAVHAGSGRTAGKATQGLKGASARLPLEASPSLRGDLAGRARAVLDILSA